ncbi:MAG: hypothetical protein H6719_34810, partial [Sandaracinaceae bacterium]|nr:hypothetical protein [Sandaracinaceae bacterium]
MGDPQKRRKALADALRGPIGAGDLAAAHRAVAQLATRDSLHLDAIKVADALELLLAEVSPDDDEVPDDDFTEGGQLLAAGQLEAALAFYEELIQLRPGERTAGLLHCVRVVASAAGGFELPDRLEVPDSIEIELSLSGLRLEDTPFGKDDKGDPLASTRVAKGGEMPLSAFIFDEVTAAIPDQEIPQAAYRPDRDEVTMQVELGDYELVEPQPVESTRVAKPGELPLEELRKIIEAEKSDAAVDGFMDALRDGEPTLDERPPRPAVPAAPVFQPPAAPAPEVDAPASSAPPPLPDREPFQPPPA